MGESGNDRTREPWDAFTHRILQQLERIDRLERTVDAATAETTSLRSHGYAQPVTSVSPRLTAILNPPMPRVQPSGDAVCGGDQRKAAIEAALRERDEEYTRAQRQHREIVRRLQSDHAESERTFHSIVAHLEQQLHQTAEHAAARSAEAQAHVDLLRNEFSAEREGIAARHAGEIEGLRRDYDQKLADLRAESERRRHIEERERDDLVHAAEMATKEAAASKSEVSLLSAEIGRLRNEVETAIATAAEATQAAELTGRELALLRETHERRRLDTEEVETRARTMLEEMQKTNEALVNDTAASLARAEAKTAQRLSAKDSEIQSLQQLVLQTKQEAAEKIKAAIEEYQARSFSVEERITSAKTQAKADADASVAELRRELEDVSVARDTAQSEAASVRKAAEKAVDELKKQHHKDLEMAVQECEKASWERQVIADEQHKLEIQRFRIAAEESQRDVIHRDRELHKDLVQLHRQHQTELETQATSFQNEIGELKKKLKDQTSALGRAQEQAERAELEKRTQVREIELVLQRERADRSSKLAEAAKECGREADRRVQRSIAKHAAELDQVTRDLQAATSEKAAADAAQIEQLYAQVADLRLKAEESDAASTRNLSETRLAHEAEMSQLREQHEIQMARLRDERLWDQEQHNDALSKSRTQYEADMEDLRSRFAQQMSRMLPAEERESLESTIVSLQSQTQALEQRCTLLQERLDHSAARFT